MADVDRLDQFLRLVRNGRQHLAELGAGPRRQVQRPPAASHSVAAAELRRRVTEDAGATGLALKRMAPFRRVAAALSFRSARFVPRVKLHGGD